MRNFRFSTAGLRRRPALADLLRLVANMKLLLVISIGSKEVWLLSVPDEHQTRPPCPASFEPLGCGQLSPAAVL